MRRKTCPCHGTGKEVVRVVGGGMHRAKLWLTAVVFGALGLSLVVLPHAVVLSAADPQGATEAIKYTIQEVIRLLQDESLQQPERAKERRQQLETTIGTRFDYGEMAKRSLGKQWKQLSDSQRQEFVELFTKLLATSYADRIEGYSGEQVEYLNERRKGPYAEVKTRVASGKVELPIDYRMLLKGTEWRVYDVVVDGVSLVRNYRGQFSKILRSSSYAALVTQLRKKTQPPSGP